MMFDAKCQAQNGSDAVCGMPGCEELISTKTASYCTGAESHYLCDSCFCGYAKAACEPTGAFERAITGDGDENIRSEPGELPCYLFLTGDCDCASLPATVIARSLSTDSQALSVYEEAKHRLIIAEQECIRQEADRAQAEARKLETPGDRLRILVSDTLSRGGRVKCPQCGISSQKDDACMHMLCICNTRFCYCCGRPRGEGDGECTMFGCDAQSPYLENNPGWDDYAIGDENDGLGALHEFHRQCMIYFLRIVKDLADPQEWSHLRRRCPEILQDIPTEGRQIDWDEIDGAAPPLFGTTEENELKWAQDFLREIGDTDRVALGDTDEHIEDGLICSLCDCNVPSNASCCSDAEPHYLCDQCFCDYAEAACEPSGAFEGERRGGENGDILSKPGELPCYCFIARECSCASILTTVIARALSTNAHVLECYIHARNRLNVAQAERDQQEAQAAQANAAERATPVDRLRNVVVEALNRGGGVECPSCGVRGQKNDACMHMTCVCGAQYCYCCGRQRGTQNDECPSDGSGCDTPSPNLEDHPGWEIFAMGNETSGMGALHEFHRRRMRFFLRQVKAQSDSGVWAELRRRYPELLQNVPTEGRHINWDGIDQAFSPLFGQTEAHHLKWAGEGFGARGEVERMEQHFENNNNRQEVEEGQEVATVTDYLSAHKCIVYVWIVVFVVALLVLVVRKAISDTNGRRVFGNTLVALLATTGLAALALHLIDNRRAYRLAYRINEVQCFGPRGYEVPYLATTGRWNKWRWKYWLIFFGFISLGSLLVGISKNVVSNNLAMERALKFVGATVLGAVLFSYAGLTYLINLTPQPRMESWYRRFLIRLSVYIAMFSIGIGLHVAFDAGTAGRNAAKCFLSLGFAGVAAETAPRYFAENLPFLRPVDVHRLWLSTHSLEELQLVLYRLGFQRIAS